MERITNFKKFMRYAGFFVLVTGLASCSDDDDIHTEVLVEIPTAIIQVDDGQTLSENILTVPSITVGQDSWLVAVLAGEENSENFIAQPVFVEKGTNVNVKLTFNESVVNHNIHAAYVILKLYVENQLGGISGEWDISDIPVTSSNNVPVTRSITIYADLTNYNAFRHTFDLNGDGALNLQEVLNTYPNNFDGLWDFNWDGYLDLQEFYNTHFLNADSNGDNVISKTEWDEGYLRMFGDWAKNDFPAFDENKDGRLSRIEWNKIFKDSEFFESYDGDANNFVTQAELHQGFFRQWDLNNDGKIDEAEFNIYRPYVMNWTFSGYWDY